MFLLSAPNYQAQAGIGRNSPGLQNVTAILDTWAGPNCILQLELPSDWEEFRKEAPAIQVRDANKNPLVTQGTTSVYVKVGTMLIKTAFLICERLSVPYLRGASFIDRFVHWINIATLNLVIRDGSKTDIISRPVRVLPRCKTRVPVAGLGSRVSAKVRVEKPTRISAAIQGWVTVRTLREGTFVMEPRHELYPETGLIADNGLVTTMRTKTVRKV